MKKNYWQSIGIDMYTEHNCGSNKCKHTKKKFRNKKKPKTFGKNKKKRGK